MKEPTTTRHRGTVCPVCQQELDASSKFEGRMRPRVGDLTVCMYCATIFTYEEGLKLRLLPQSEIERLRPEELKEVREYQAAVLNLNAREGGQWRAKRNG